MPYYILSSFHLFLPSMSVFSEADTIFPNSMFLFNGLCYIIGTNRHVVVFTLITGEVKISSSKQQRLNLNHDLNLMLIFSSSWNNPACFSPKLTTTLASLIVYLSLISSPSISQNPISFSLKHSPCFSKSFTLYCILYTPILFNRFT